MSVTIPLRFEDFLKRWISYRNRPAPPPPNPAPLNRPDPAAPKVVEAAVPLALAPVPSPKPRQPRNPKELVESLLASLGGDPGYIGCSYWETLKGQRKLHPMLRQACFASMTVQARAIRYLCPVSAYLTEDHCRFWIRFLRRWLTTLPWDAQIVRAGPKDALYVYYHLKRTCAHSRATTLLYLTAFRYLSEFYPVVKTLYDDRALCETPEDLFKTMQEMSFKQGRYKDHPEIKRATTMSGHGLVYCGYGSASEPVPVDKVKRNLEEGKGTVFSHFA